MDLIFLHGRAASGKLTTARALQSLVGYPVFHNHAVVDLLTSMFQFGSEPFVKLREQTWLAVFAEAARVERSIIFTFTPEATVRSGFALRARETVEAERGRVRFVRLTVSDAEQERRINNPSRHEFHKLTDLDTLRRLRSEPTGEQPPADLEVDTGRSCAASTAAYIAERLRLPRQQLGPRYPSR